MISPARSIFLFCMIVAVALVARAQSPQIVVQAANAAAAPSPQIVVQAANAATPAPAQVVVTQDNNSLSASIKLLEQLKTANEETLKRQEAALQQLDEISKATDQIKIFAHRD
jgi:hypothetical protein